MAYYAILNENNVVIQVITGVDENELLEGISPEEWYSNFTGKTCKRTSYNTYGNQHINGGTAFRGNYAGIGSIYDETFDVFIPPKKFPSWKLNYTTYQWEPPIPIPAFEEGYDWLWSEINQEWVKIAIPSQN